MPPTQSTAGNESLADVLRELIRSELERRVCGPHERHVRQQIASTIACIFDAGGVQVQFIRCCWTRELDFTNRKWNKHRTL